MNTPLKEFNFSETIEPAWGLGHSSQVSQLNKVLEAARELGISQNVNELDAYGYTVVPPDKVAPTAFHERLLQAMLDVHERYSGQRITDVHSPVTPVSPVLQMVEGGGAAYFHLLFEDPVFQEAVLNPVVLALARYLCGSSAVVSDFAAIVRGKSDNPPLLLHTDTVGVPPPLTPYAQVCNITWALTDYTKADGATAIVPGSHRFMRQPAPHEGNGFTEDAPYKAVAAEGAAGSIVAWHGNTWHGAWPRENPGVRVNLVIYFCRPYMRPLIDYRDHAPEEVVGANPQLARLLGFDVPYPLKLEKGQFVEPDKIATFGAGGSDVWY